MDNIINILENNEYLRGLVMLIYILLLIQISGRKLFGQYSALETLVLVTVGSILSRAIDGTNEIIPTMLVSLLIILVYRFLIYLSYKSHTVGKFIKGEPILLFEKKEFLKTNLKRNLLTDNDILEALRSQHGLSDLAKVQKIYLERNGMITFIKDDIK